MEENNHEKAILVGLKIKGSDFSFETSMEELQGLAEAAGAEVVATLIQAKDRPANATYIGKGKLEELSHLVTEFEPDLIVFDNELSPVQLRNLEEELQVKIIDRSMLILDIFSQRARSREGKLQVELANLEYRLPRLTGRGVGMSRLGGGIGTRGSGEQKLELDRRNIRARIRDVKKQMQKVEKTREIHRKQRQRAGLKVISLVGYTNAGKSSLFNTLCKNTHRSGNEQVEADQRLFQTLDTTTRKIKLPSGLEVLITDTVGFIQNLPHHLIAAFRSTLEEAIGADILLHVVDAADPNYLEKVEMAEKVLFDLGAEEEKFLLVFNKADLVENDFDLQIRGECISAMTGQGIETLLARLDDRLGMA